MMVRHNASLDMPRHDHSIEYRNPDPSLSKSANFKPTKVVQYCRMNQDLNSYPDTRLYLMGHAFCLLSH